MLRSIENKTELSLSAFMSHFVIKFDSGFFSIFLRQIRVKLSLTFGVISKGLVTILATWILWMY